MRRPERPWTRLLRWPPVALAKAVHDRTTELGGGFLASAVTLALFLSLFPMLLLAVSVLGFMAAGDGGLASSLVRDLGLSGGTADLFVDAVAAAEDGRGGAGVVGLLGLAWAASGVAGAIGHLCDRVWQVPGRGLRDRLIGLAWVVGGLVLLGGSMAVGGLLAVLPAWAAPLDVALGLALQLGFFLVTFRVLTAKDLPWRTHLPGAATGAVGVQVLGLLAALIVPRQLDSASGLYGSIGAVLAVLAWLLLFGRLLAWSAVLNVVLHERRHGTVHVEVEVPRFEGEVPLVADRSGVVQEPGRAPA